MPTIADVKKALEAVDGGSDLVTVLDGELSKLRTESGKYRTRAKTLADHIGVDLSADDLEGSLADLKAKSKAKGGKLDPEVEERISTLQKTVESWQKKAEDAESKRVQTETRSLVKDALAKNKALRPDDLTELLLSRVRLEDGKPQFIGDDGQSLSVADGVASWLKGRPDFVGSTQQPGPGGAGNRNGATGNVPSITRAEFDAKVAANDPLVFKQIADKKLVVVD